MRVSRSHVFSPGTWPDPVLAVLVALILFGGAYAAALTAQGGATLHAPRHPIAEELAPWTCQLPAVPGIPSQRILVDGRASIAWCVDGATFDQAKAATWTASVDGGASTILLHACSSAYVSPILCYALVPANTVLALIPRGTHRVTIATATIPSLAPLALDVVVPTCIVDGVTYDVGAPLPSPPVTAPNGNLYSTLGTFPIETRIGRLRADGWRVEWMANQWTPFVSTATATLRGGATTVLGWCVGSPQ